MKDFPAICSAVAAAFAAFTSFLMWRIARNSWHHSVRPEIVLTDWSRFKRVEGESLHEVIKIEKIRNVGNGPALGVIPSGKIDNPPTAVLSADVIPILASDETLDYNGEIAIWWKNVKEEKTGGKILPIKIQFYCWDTGRSRHTTEYTFLAFEHGSGSNEVAPGLQDMMRSTKSTPIWILKFRSRLGKMWRWLCPKTPKDEAGKQLDH